MHNRKLNRLPGYDYSKTGHYFVTICTKDRVPWFGDIQNQKMTLNEIGMIVKNQWEWSGKKYPYLELDEYIIMPDHVHGIIRIVGNAPDIVGNGRDRSLQVQKIKPLPELIGAFKTTSSKLIHLAGLLDFAWQKSFYDHVIRNEQSLSNIRRYIINNTIKS